MPSFQDEDFEAHVTSFGGGWGEVRGSISHSENLVCFLLTAVSLPKLLPLLECSFAPIPFLLGEI